VACALALGLLIGYLAYAVTHHAIHHTQDGSDWLRRRRRWHARHHRSAGDGICYGVTSGFWDRIFGSAGRGGGVRQRTDAAAAHPYNQPLAEPLHPQESKAP
jgi:sterol desaturase/sphingolipid hydroxylase (fatty acid hydroxylase superfamily)